MVGGAPAAGVDVRLESGSMLGGGPGYHGPTPRFRAKRDKSVSRTSAADGAFRFEGVEMDSYRVIARASDGRVALVPVFKVDRGASIDLSTIELSSGAEIRGVVLVPPGRRASGLAVRLDDPNEGEKQVTDSDGRFRFAGVLAGAHELLLPDVTGAFARVPPVELELAAGEVRDVEIDAREHGTCDVELLILFGDKPAADAQVSLSSVRSKGSPAFSIPGAIVFEHLLGKTDGQGRVSGSVPAVGVAGLSVWTADNATMEHPTARFDLRLDARIVETVRFEVATVIVELPESVRLPPSRTAAVG
jgi:hypothetical protein